MSGLPIEQINTMKNLKDMIISQLQAVYGRSYPIHSKFDVMYLKKQHKYHARAIVYDGSPRERIHRSRWSFLVDGEGCLNVLAALENLWTLVLEDAR
ncbi:hypothetical protein E8E13_008206 [Curvularia kusanoi]|uniref:Uncharacterized protein n=1 Tax=Curvularia kusanoi TaxID=90978 RepID=A0A9P4TCW3_CURKU|nr:hypothetical protein E8E13_008206 [Curvularia kusanoi]